MIHPYNDHDAVVLFDDTPCLLWMPSTSGLSRDSDLPSMSVYVAGTQTVMIPDETTMAVTLLIAVKDSEFKKAIFGDRQTAAKKRSKGKGAMRTWTAGRHSVVAKVVRVDDEEVELEKINGKTIVVARSKLSDADNDFLNELE